MITDKQEAGMEKTQIFQWVAIKALIVEEGKILLGKRLDQDDHGLFEIPGGKLEVGETFRETLKREVLEETGVEIDPIDLQESEGKPIFMAQTKSRHRVTVVILAKVLNKDKMVEKTDELDEIKFYSKEEVGKLIEGKLVRSVFAGLLKRFVQGEI